ncbi:MAG: hypothetical protein ABIH46_07040 [Chloroflexota bacterium]
MHLSPQDLRDLSTIVTGVLQVTKTPDCPKLLKPYRDPIRQHQLEDLITILLELQAIN